MSKNGLASLNPKYRLTRIYKTVKKRSKQAKMMNRINPLYTELCNKNGSSRIHVELSEADQDPLLKIDKIPKSVTHAFHCLDRIVNTFNDARGHPMREVV